MENEEEQQFRDPEINPQPSHLECYGGRAG